MSNCHKGAYNGTVCGRPLWRKYPLPMPTFNIAPLHLSVDCGHLLWMTANKKCRNRFQWQTSKAEWNVAKMQQTTVKTQVPY